MKQEGTGPYLDEKLRHQPLPILGDGSIVVEAVSGITNKNIYKTDIEMTV